MGLSPETTTYVPSISNRPSGMALNARDVGGHLEFLERMQRPKPSMGENAQLSGMLLNEIV
jgi:hypothetical protein